MKSPHAAAWGFNPLHCGAVVASARSPQGGGARRKVSIPFIAGQWSLRRSRPSFGRSWPSFNPLHCGAVVASGVGQCSRRRRPRFNPLHCGAVVASGSALLRARRRARVSIPFIAGQWSLHAGALVQRLRHIVFQSPSLRGSGRFGDAFEVPPCCGMGFQSPSLRGSGRFSRQMPSRCSSGSGTFQSPSLRGSGRFGRR